MINDDDFASSGNSLYVAEHSPGIWYWLVNDPTGQRLAQCTRSFSNSFECFWDAARTPGVQIARLVTLRHSTARSSVVPWAVSHDPA